MKTILALLLLAAAAPVAAQTPVGKPSAALLDEFVRLQDLAYTAAGEARCAPEGEQAERAFHGRYDRRLVRLADWLQKTFTDADLKSAQARVHGIDFTRTPPQCPVAPEEIAAGEKAYADALAKLELEVANHSGPEESR